MSNRDPDVIVIGSGPNGLCAAATLAKKGFRVLIVEANPRRPGGALGSEEATEPGFLHDVGAAFFPFAKASPAFRFLEVDRHVEWVHSPFESCHPAPDGSVACIARDPEANGRAFGSEHDGAVWHRLSDWHRLIETRFLDLLLGPFPAFAPVLALGPLNLLKMARIFASSGRSLSERLFRTPAARRVLPGLGLHADAGPDDTFSAALGYVLGAMATTGGFPVPVGGARRLANALVHIFESHGGRIRLGARATRVIVSGGRAAAVRLEGGEDIPASRAIVADTGAPSLLLDLMERGQIPARVLRRMERFEYSWGTFKVDWALTASVPWSSAAARDSAVVHAGDDLDDLSRFTKEVRAGKLPNHPYLVIGQQSLADASRAPPGHHTLWAYTHVPPHIDGGWDAVKEPFTDVIERRIEELAPGFRARILARRAVTPADLEAMDSNLVGGDIGGGSNAWNRQLLWRPVFPYFRYRMPVRGLYLCSSYAHPGAGVHGMCGYNAARIAARDIG